MREARRMTRYEAQVGETQADRNNAAHALSRRLRERNNRQIAFLPVAARTLIVRFRQVANRYDSALSRSSAVFEGTEPSQRTSGPAAAKDARLHQGNLDRRVAIPGSRCGQPSRPRAWHRACRRASGAGHVEVRLARAGRGHSAILCGAGEGPDGGKRHVVREKSFRNCSDKAASRTNNDDVRGQRFWIGPVATATGRPILKESTVP